MVEPAFTASSPGVLATAGPARVVEDLARDHGLIVRATVALERCVARLAGPGDVEARERDHLACLIGFFREFTEGIHDAKEEDALIPALVGAGVAADTGVVREIMDAHLHATRLLASVTATRGERSVPRVSEYCEVVREHLRAEEHSLFPLVARHLDAAGEQRVMVGFRQIAERGGASRSYDRFDREIERLLSPLDELYPDRKRPW